MLKNYLKIALRSFGKQRLTSAINIIGLSIGIACAGFGFVFIQHELSFDRFHDEAEQIYWLSASIQNKVNISSTPGPLSPELKDKLPEITEALRLEDHEMLVQSGNEFFRETGHFVDPNFFSFFNFNLIAGTPDQALTEVNAVVLSEKMAQKYFGRLSPLGQSLKINYQGKDEIFEVSGIASDAPANSSLQFDFLLPLDFIHRDDPVQLGADWNSFPVTSFVRLRNMEDEAVVRGKLPAFITENATFEDLDQNQLSFHLRSLLDYHLKDEYFANGLIPPAGMAYIRILALIAILILLVACLNFMNLSNAKSSGRLTEVGVRRVMGAMRQQLVGQFLAEAILMSLIALGLGILLIEGSLPYIAGITGTPLSINWAEPKILLPLLIIALLTGALAGIYPATIMARLKAVQAFKNELKAGGNNLVTKGSLIFQFALSIGLLSCTFIMYQQQQYIKDRNLGFDQDEIVVIATQSSRTEAAASQRLVEQFKNETAINPDILRISGASQSFNQGNSALFVAEEDGTNTPVFYYEVDADYLPLLDIELQEGQNFSTGVEAEGIIVNETFLQTYDISIPVDDYRLPEKFGDLAGSRIIGVVKDYNFLNLKSKMHPMFLRKKSDARFGHMLVKIQPGKVEQTLAQLRSTWQKLNPDKPFEFTFLDEDIQQQYTEEARWNKAITGATVLAVLIACLGLFGLIALMLTERTKEIGIRKILGASIPDIAWLVSRQFVLLLGLAALVAIPAAWWSMQKWLENYAYQIDLQWVVFLAAVGITLLIALLTVGLQAAKAAMRNPVEALRHE